VDEAIQFCERCGRDRDAFAASRAAFRDCPACGSACCPDCWNLVEGACLACAPFRLRAETSRSHVVPVAGDHGEATAPPGSPAAPASAPHAPLDPYADLRDGPGTTTDVDALGRPVGPGILGTWDATRPSARQRPRDAPAAGNAPALAAPDAWRAVVAAADPVPPARRRRRSSRVAVAAVAGWVFVGALAVGALGANTGGMAVVGPTPRPPTPPATAAPTQVPTPVATTKPTAKPKPARAPKATPKPVRRVTVRPAATARPVRSTPRPPKPPAVVTPPPVAPPTAPPAETPAP
jgi:hypothetical protein